MTIPINITASPNPIAPGDAYTITIVLQSAPTANFPVDISIYLPNTGKEIAIGTVTFTAGQTTLTVSSTNLSLTTIPSSFVALGGTTIYLLCRSQADKNAPGTYPLIQKFNWLVKGNYGIEAYTNSNVPVLLDGMVGSRVFIDLVSSTTTGAINFPNIPSGTDLLPYVVESGNYDWDIVTVTGTPSYARITFKYTGGDANVHTKLALFAKNTREPDYGITVTNLNGTKLVSNEYPVPVFLSRVTFSNVNYVGSSFVGTNYKSYYYEKTINLGTPNSHKMILWRIPRLPAQNNKYWYTGLSFKEANSGNMFTITFEVIEDKQTNFQGMYPLPEAYVFQLNNLDDLVPTTDKDYGINLYNSAGKLTFSSSLPHLYVPSISTLTWPTIAVTSTRSRYAVGAVNLADVGSGFINPITDDHAFFIPQLFTTQINTAFSGSTPYKILEVIRGAFRRSGYTPMYLDYACIKTVETFYFDSNAVDGTELRHKTQNAFFTADISRFGALANAQSSLSYTIDIVYDSGSETCTTDGTTNCNCVAIYKIVINTPSGVTPPTTINYTSSHQAYRSAAGSTISVIHYGNQTGNEGRIKVDTSSTADFIFEITAAVRINNSIDLDLTKIFTHSRTVSLVPPTATISFAKTTLGPNQQTALTITTSRSTSDLAANDITIAGGGSITNFSGSGTSYTATYTAPTTPTQNPVQVYIAANRFSSTSGSVLNTAQSNTENITIVTAKPVVTFSTPTEVGENQSFSIKVTLNRAPYNSAIEAGDFSISGAYITNVTANTTTEYIITLTSLSEFYSDGTNSYHYLNITITLLADAFFDEYNLSNVETQSSINWDKTAPTVTLSAVNTALLTSGKTTVTATLSESINTSSFTSSDITIVGGGSISNFAGTGKTRTFTYTAPTTAGSPTVSILANKFVDLNNLYNLASNILTFTVTVPDTTAPTITEFSTTNASITYSQSTQISVKFSEAVQGFDLSDVTITGPAEDTNLRARLGTFSSDPNKQNYAFWFTGNRSTAGTYTLKIDNSNTIQDLSNNNLSGSSTLNITTTVPDTTKPSVTISSAKTIYAGGATPSITITFSEPVTDFTASDVTLTCSNTSYSATAGTLTTTNNTVFTLPITLPSINCSVTVGIAAGVCQDSSGNTNTAASNYGITVDADQPIPTLSALVTKTKASQKITITFSLQDNDNLTAPATSIFYSTGGTVANLVYTSSTKSGTVDWTLPNIEGTYQLYIKENQYLDRAGNNNKQSSTINISVDATQPKFNITPNNTRIPFNSSTGITYVASEPLLSGNKLSATDVSVNTGTLSSFTVSAVAPDTTFTQNYTAPHVTGTSRKNSLITEQKATVTIAANTVEDVVGNFNTAASTTDITLYPDYCVIDSTKGKVSSTYGTDANKALRSGTAENVTFEYGLDKLNNTGLAVTVFYYIDGWNENTTAWTRILEATQLTSIGSTNTSTTFNFSITLNINYYNKNRITIFSNTVDGSCEIEFWTVQDKYGGYKFSGYLGAGGLNSAGGTTSFNILNKSNEVAISTTLTGGDIGGSTAGSSSGSAVGGAGGITGTSNAYTGWPGAGYTYTNWSAGGATGGKGGNPQQLASTTQGYAGSGAGVPTILPPVSTNSTSMGASAPTIASSNTFTDKFTGFNDGASKNFISILNSIFNISTAGTLSSINTNKNASGWGSGGAGGIGYQNSSTYRVGGTGSIGGGGGGSYRIDGGSSWGGRGGDAALLVRLRIRGSIKNTVFIASGTSTANSGNITWTDKDGNSITESTTVIPVTANINGTAVPTNTINLTVPVGCDEVIFIAIGSGGSGGQVGNNNYATTGGGGSGGMVIGLVQ